MTTIAVFGGSFNPPHVAHVQAVRVVASRSDVERVLVVPCFSHPFDKALAPFEERLALCEVAFAGVPKVEVSRIEADLGGESVTIRTLEELRRRHPEARLAVVVGADVLPDWKNWFRVADIQKMAERIVLGRPGFPLPPGETEMLPDVSSTEIRRRLAADEPVDDLVPPAVQRRIRERGLYRAG